LDQSRGSLDAAVLTHALQKTVEFEKEVRSLWRAEIRVSQLLTRRPRVTQVHAQFGPEMIAEAEADADADAAKTSGVGGGPKLLGSISSCFDSYMARAARAAASLRGRLTPGPNGNHLANMATAFLTWQGIYVALEDKGVDEAVSKLLSDEDWAVARTGRPDSRVFNSSKELFIALKRSFKRGTALRMPNVLYDLHTVWAKHLRTYARRVHEQLPPLVPPADVSASHTCNLDLASQQKVCAVVNTCVYCSDTIGQLEDSIGKALAEDQFKKSVDLGLVKEEFQSVLTAGMKVSGPRAPLAPRPVAGRGRGGGLCRRDLGVFSARSRCNLGVFSAQVLVAALETRIAPSLGVMTRHKWDLVEELSEDTSQYMRDIVSAARETMPQASSRDLPRSPVIPRDLPRSSARR